MSSLLVVSMSTVLGLWAGPAIKSFSDGKNTTDWESGPALVEQCSGARVRSKLRPSREKCTRWRVEWRQDGKVWGVTVASSYAEVVKEQQRVSAFARRYARYFGKPVDPRFSDPSEPVCEGCQQKDAGEVSGLWGEGQRFGGLEANRARSDAQARLDAFEAELGDKHLPDLRDVARLSKDPKLSKAALKYGKAMEVAVRDAVRLQLELDNAGIYRSAKPAESAAKLIEGHTKALGTSRDALVSGVAKEVVRSHGGRYSEDNYTGTDTSQLLFDVDGNRVTLSHLRGTARSVWFEGEIRLDGRVAGKSLVAPEGKPLKCNDHKIECGFVHVPAVVRFTKRPRDKGKAKQVLELWFQQSKWIPAKTFSR